MKESEISSKLSPRVKQWLYLLATVVVAFPISLILTQSTVMASAISTVALALPIEMTRLRRAKALKAEREAWPIAIDHLISAVSSGISIPQALNDLIERGPEALTRQFAEIKRAIDSGVAFHDALRMAKRRFHTSAADQVLEVLIIARVTGSSNVGTIFRTLGEFLGKRMQCERRSKRAMDGFAPQRVSLQSLPGRCSSSSQHSRQRELPSLPRPGSTY